MAQDHSAQRFTRAETSYMALLSAEWLDSAGPKRRAEIGEDVATIIERAGRRAGPHSELDHGASSRRFD